MASHLRFKRHLRFLQDGEVVRVVRDLANEVTLPAGAVFDRLLEALQLDLPEAELQAELSQRIGLEAGIVDNLLARLFELHLLERFDPQEVKYERFDRQQLLWDAFEPVSDNAMSVQRQERLARAHVLVLGLGGIGHHIALSLAAAGVGALTLVDDDVVEESNLHRQILFAAKDVGRKKVSAARDGLLRISPACSINTVEAVVQSAGDWQRIMSPLNDVRHVVLSADKPVQLVEWLSDSRVEHAYHFIKCGYMTTQGLIGPLLGPDTKDYGELYRSWSPVIDEQPEHIKAFNARSIAPTMAASNAIMANVAALELIKHITGAGALTLLGKRLLLDLNTYSIQPG